MPGKATLVRLDEKAREVIGKGVRAIYDPVRRTLGPEGKNALIYRTYNRGPRITNDGVTVSEVIEPKDPFVRLAAGAFKEAAKRTNEKAGDGTTTTIVIGGALFETVEKKLTSEASTFTATKGVGVMTVRRQIIAEAETVKELIKKAAKKVKDVDDLTKIATVSVEDAEIGKIIAQMAWDVGIEGFIDVVEGYKGEIETETIKGMRFPAKVANKSFVNNPARYEMVAVDSSVLITNYALDNAIQLGRVFPDINKKTAKLIVFAPSFSDNVLVNMVNACKQGFFIYPVAVPSLRTEQLEDLAAYCGARLIDKSKGAKIENITPNDLGSLDKIVVKDSEAKEDAVAIGGAGTRDQGGSSVIEDRIKMLQGQLAETKEVMFKKLMERRIASMASAVGIIRVGAVSQAESLYKKLKIEDAVYASKAALRGGYVKGGGLCLKEIADDMPDTSILKPALLAPYEQIRSNAGVEKMDIGKDIIDPMEAVYYAVDHATSVVANLVTVEVIIPEEPEIAPGDGEKAIARAINEYTLAWMRQQGLLKASEEEMERDKMTNDERVSSDNG